MDGRLPRPAYERSPVRLTIGGHQNGVKQNRASRDHCRPTPDPNFEPQYLLLGSGVRSRYMYIRLRINTISPTTLPWLDVACHMCDLHVLVAVATIASRWSAYTSHVRVDYMYETLDYIPRTRLYIPTSNVPRFGRQQHHL